MNVFRTTISGKSYVWTLYNALFTMKFVDTRGMTIIKNRVSVSLYVDVYPLELVDHR